MFTHYKALAVQACTPQGVLHAVGAAAQLPQPSVAPRHYEGLLRQHALPVMGAAVDLAALLAEAVQQLVEENVAVLVRRHEVMPLPAALAPWCLALSSRLLAMICTA